MTNKKELQLYDLLTEFIYYTMDCKEVEKNEEVLIKIEQAMINAKEIRNVITLGF